ncbi:polycystin-1 [Trichomycterus rosablanca]|uniref:polycystin-1 n=1 Tax=Trichomycterus rosablanca TaxID=2290929 RepID=UPI002F3553E1
MPCRNGLTGSGRKHGVCLCALAPPLLLLLLLALAGLGAAAGETGACSPCPGNCSCTVAAHADLGACVVNCSGRALEWSPSVTELPTDTHTLDLSRNFLSSVDAGLFDHLPAIKEMYLQNNRITALPNKAMGCGSLAVLDLSSNPFVCNCMLVQLVRRLQQKDVVLRRASQMLCDRPAKLKDLPLLNVSSDDCELYYAGCLQDDAHPGGSELVIFSSSAEGNFSRRECNSRCFLDRQLYGGLGTRGECLCSTNSEPNHISEAQCSAACSNATVMRDCGLTVAQDVFQVDFTVGVWPVRSSVHSEASFSVSSSVTPVSLYWDFGDSSPLLNTSVTAARHKYGLPGRYRVKVVAAAAHKEATGVADVDVELPPRLELHCPSTLLPGQSLEEAVTLVNWGGAGVSVGWTVKKDDAEVERDELVCVPEDAPRVNSSRCFELVPDELSWAEARRRCSDRGGELAIVQSDVVLDLIARRFTQDRTVWLGLSDVDSSGTLRWVDGSSAAPGGDGVQESGAPVDGDRCVSLGSDGLTSSDPCAARHAYVCQFKRQARVSDAGVYQVGVAVFNTQTSLTRPNVSSSPVAGAPAGAVELLLFPSLSFGHSGRLASLELITRSLSSHTQVRFQVYRPHCPHRGLQLLLPECGDLCSPVALCRPLDSTPNETATPPATSAPPCPAWQQWCPYKGSCSPLGQPCHPDLCPNCSGAEPSPAGTVRPQYSLVGEALFTLPPAPPTIVSVQETIEDLLVAPGDFIGLQHDAGPSGLLGCAPDSSSPWKQSLVVQNHSDWVRANETLEANSRWMEDAVCPIRALYVGMNHTKLRGPLLRAGLPQAGNYSLEVTSDHPDYPVSASCPIHVTPPLRLTLVYPGYQNGTVYFSPDRSSVLVRVQSEYSAVVGTREGNRTVPFQSSCPEELLPKVAECRTPGATNNTLFAWLDLSLDVTPGSTKVALYARSEVTDDQLEVQASVEEPLRGLQIQPHPAHRVLMETVVNYAASVEGGTDPSFRWTVDDKPYFTYYNTVLNIIYQNPAVYKLTVTASNHVSSLTENFNVTVDRMNPMSEITVRGVPEIVTQGDQLTLSAVVEVDVSVNATFQWMFGEGDKTHSSHFTPPYDVSNQSPDPSKTQIILQNEVKYVYSQPGEYTLMVSVSNRYENRMRKLDVYVFSILTSVEIDTEPELLRAGEFAAFEAHPLPSPYGIVYTWNFGDNSSLQQGRERRVHHAYSRSGTYAVCVNVNNTISSNDTCKVLTVYEDVRGLAVAPSGPTELNTPTLVRATLESGNNVSWSFSMGDDTVIDLDPGAEPRVEHRYKKEGNYTVNVTAANAVGSRWETVHVEVFVLQVLWLEPAGCVREGAEIDFRAHVSGNASAHRYTWSFGDETANRTRDGVPSVTHLYASSGSYHLSLLMSSAANKANFFTWVCVQPALTNVTLRPLTKYVRLGEESVFTVSAHPKFDYTYLWNFGLSDFRSPIPGNRTMAFTYTGAGAYVVTVTVLNNISLCNRTALVEVQEPVGVVLIRHNGTRGGNLASRQDYAFASLSDFADAAFDWDFGDGTLVSGANVTHAYDSSGTFTISVIVRNQVSENRSELAVTVLSPIQGLSVNASLVSVPLNATVHFETHLEQGDGVRFSWIVCDRCTSIPGTYNMFYTFRSVGTFNIIVTAENNISVAQASIYIFVQRELDGLQVASDELGDGCCFATNRVLHLHAVLKEGTNMSFVWNVLCNSENFTATGRTVELNYSAPGPCEVFLRATNLLGTLSVNRTIEFLDLVGEVVLTADPDAVVVGARANLTVFTSTGSDPRYTWWIDGTCLPLDSSSLLHTFDQPGMKLVRVEVSNRVSAEVGSVLVSVQEPVSGLAFVATNVTEQNFVASGVNVSLLADVRTGSNVSWTWLLPGGARSTRQVTSCVFPSPGTFSVALNASNDISGEVLERDFFVQDRIQGLEFRASKNIVAVGENVEFGISVASGTSVSYALSISGDATVHPNLTYVHQFSRVDNYYANLTAWNQISSERRNLHIVVMEPITKLTILDCCEQAIPVGVPKTFEAHIATGNQVTYIWTFDLHHGVKQTLLDSKVTYVPEEPGFLTISVCALNALNVQNETKDVLIQNVLKLATLEAQPRDTFVNKTVVFQAGVSPQSTALRYQWNFGDGSLVISSDTSLVTHVYSLPGRYLARVNVSNFVSFVTAQFEVNIRVLECSEPEVHVVQAPRLAIWRSKASLVEAKVNLKGCTRYTSEYLWEVFTAPQCQDFENHLFPPAKVYLPGEVDARRLQLSIPKMSLPAKNYTLVFSLSYKGIPLRKTACLQLSVMSAKLVPIIEGGTYRVWSKTQDLQLNANQSYDPNLDPESQTLLMYHWECLNTTKGVSHCSTLNLRLGPKDLRISGWELEVDVEYTFRLTISKEGMHAESTTQKVLVKSGRIPIVSLECVSCKALSRYEISQNSYVYLAGTCSNCHGSYRGRWTAMNRHNEPLVLDLNTTTTRQDSMNLVLRRGALRDGDSYTFSLHITDDSMEQEGVANIELRPNHPPAGGTCVLWADEEGPVHTLLQRVHFNCTGYTDLDESESPLVYSLLVLRCAESSCEDFCVYKGTSPEHSTFLPPGFSSSQYRVSVSVTVEDHQGASVTALNKTMTVVLPQVPDGYSSLAHWLYVLTDTMLNKLLKQGDSQSVRELSLALVTVLNEYEQRSPRRREGVSRQERQYRVSVRGNVTRALTSLDLNTVSDIQQTSAALAQCTAREFVCEECQNSTLNKLESMLEILQTDTKQGTVTPTEIADNILNIMGDLIHQVNQAASLSSDESEDRVSGYPVPSLQSSLLDQPHPLRVAAKAYTLSSELMQILMLSRVLNEEPLILRGADIAAAGKRADPHSLLCYGQSDAPECRRFSIPRAFNSSLGNTLSTNGLAGEGVVQLLFQVEPNPFPFNYVPNYTVSTEVASMEFRTVNGTQIPIADLDESQAITVALNNGTAARLDGDGTVVKLEPVGAVNVSRCGSVTIRVSTGNNNERAGVYVQLNFTVLKDSPDNPEDDPSIMAYLHTSEWPNEYNSTDRKRITLSTVRGGSPDHQLYTFFLSPLVYNTTQDHFINVTAGCTPRWPAQVRVEVGVFTALCQYFSELGRMWQTDGMVPLPETSAGRAVCSTRHLTVFAASLFIPPHAVTFTVHDAVTGRSMVVLLVCVVCLLCYAVAAPLLRKLDQLDLRRASVVPLCGKDGLYKYEVQVKTGWRRGAGTTAHVGISLHGSESHSGHRHLDQIGAFARNGLDIFHVATDSSLGNLLKIRVWHDNKGLSPAWLLQYVLVKDLQSGSSYFFVVDEWLSVDNERTGGRVEIEAEPLEEAELRRWPRLLSWELQRGVCEGHLWVSLWEKPGRSPFTRLHRGTCCCLLLQLLLLANTVWYATVTYAHSLVPVSEQVPLDAEVLGVGVVSCLVIYPLYLLIFCLFRLSRSKVTVEKLPPQVDQESLEIDDFLDNSMTGSSFLIFNGIPTETYSEETNIDLPTPSSKRWSLPDGEWPEGASEPSVEMAAGFPPRLKRGQGSRHLGVDMAFNPDEDEAAGRDHRNKYFTSSDEDLIKRILTDGQLLPQDSETGDLSSIFGDKTEVILLQKMSDPVPAAVRKEPPKTAFTSRTVEMDVCKPRPLPSACGLAALWGSWTALILSSGVMIWLGLSLSERVALMWLISCMVGFLTSFCVLEPLKVLMEGAYFGLKVRRLRPEEGDVLVDCPRVERVVQRVPRVRPPQGFALSQAREEARKVRLLHRMLTGFSLYMLFLLVVLLLNYADSSRDAHHLRLRAQLEDHVRSHHANVSSRDDVWAWLSDSLLPRLLDGPALMKSTGSLLLGKPRLRQQRSRPACPASGYFPASSWFGCGPAGWAESSVGVAQNWSRSVSQSTGAWHWGRASVYDGGGFVQELSRNTEESRTLIEELHTHRWLDPLTRVLFVEFSLYNTNTDLLSVLTFLLEFPVSERAQFGLDLKTCSLQTLRRGVDLPLFLTLVLTALLLYFSVREGVSARRQGWGYFLRAWNLVGAVTLLLAAGVVALQLRRSVLASRLWDSYLRRREAFVDFFPLAQQDQVLVQINAALLFLLVLKASHQLRFLREWAVFGRTLRRSVWELLTVALALLVLLLAYSHTGYLLFHSLKDGYGTVSSAGLSLLDSGRPGLPSWRPDGGSHACPASCFVFHVSFAALRLLLLWLLISALLRNYRRVRAELYRPAVDLQDYEMVELFLRRLKMWIGLSRTKEFRHKVRFEGMELPPSRSSSTSDCKSLCLPPLDAPEPPPSPDSVDGGSEASWHPTSGSPCGLAEAPGLSLGLSLSLGVVPGGPVWKERPETDATLRRVLPAFDALLLQLDRVNQATEELYHTECRLETVGSLKEGLRDGGQGAEGQRRRKGSHRRRHKGDKAKKDVGAPESPKKEEGSDVCPPKIDSVDHTSPQEDSQSPRGANVGPPKAQADLDRKERRADLRPIRVEESAVKMKASASVAEAGPCRPSKGPRKALSKRKKVDPSPGTVDQPAPPPTSAPSRGTSTPCSATATPVPVPRPLDWGPPGNAADLPSSLFNHPAHTATMPTRKRKHKHAPMRNKIHPNTDRPVSGHCKPEGR